MAIRWRVFVSSNKLVNTNIHTQIGQLAQTGELVSCSEMHILHRKGDEGKGGFVEGNDCQTLFVERIFAKKKWVWPYRGNSCPTFFSFLVRTPITRSCGQL